MTHPITTQHAKLQPGDTLLVTTDRTMSAENADALRAYVLKHIPPGVFALVLRPGITVSVPGENAPFERECEAADELMRLLGLEPEQCRTEGGAINLPRVRSLLADRKAFNGTDHLEALLDDLRAAAFQAGGMGDLGSDAMFKASDALREFFAELAASLPESPIRQQLITKRELEQFAHNGRLAERIQTTDAKLAEATTAKDAAYRERNQLVALLARLYPSGIAQTPIEGWHPDWHGCVYIDLPTGQASWHFHTSEAHLFADLPPYAGSWDGHTTEEKYRRVAALAAQQAARRAEQQAGRSPADGALTGEDLTRALNLAYQFRSHPASRSIDEIEQAGELILSLLSAPQAEQQACRSAS